MKWITLSLDANAVFILQNTMICVGLWHVHINIINAINRPLIITFLQATYAVSLFDKLSQAIISETVTVCL